VSQQLNKKFDLMLTRRAKTYSSYCLVVYLKLGCSRYVNIQILKSLNA